MRYQLMATYLGVPYQAGLGPDGAEATLFSPAPPPEELGFAAAAGHWRKQVSLADLEALWQSRPVGDYRGEPCLVLDDLGDRLHIAYLGRDTARATQLGYWEIDREVFEVVVARRDVTGLTEERVDFPLAAAMFPSSGAESQARPSTGVAPAAEPAGSRPPGGQPLARPAARQAVAAPAGPEGPAAAAENGWRAGYGSTEHASRAPDRIAAWHGSPGPDLWAALPAGGDAGPGPDSGSWPGREPRSEPRPERESGPGSQDGDDACSDPATGHDAGAEARADGETWPDPATGRETRPEPSGAPPPGRRTGHKDRISPESVFDELLTLSAIPQAAYAVDDEVPGAMCLVKADGGFEVFSRTDDARLDVRFFEDEEAAYFYLFGVLAAEAVRSGRLGPRGAGGANGHNNGSGAPRTSSPVAGNVSKYLQGRKLPKSASHPARV
jgi:hypothetical protein